MTHPLDSGGFLGERVSPNAVWRWRLHDARGERLPDELTGAPNGPRFTSQSDAETWLGESWRDLADAGVDSVTLLEGDREVYGPMSLHA
jgi:hypothetical protein